MDLRKDFWETILKMAKDDDKIIVLTGDLGFSFCEKFQLELPNQFINCGIAEQNMIGVAAGLALGGFKPYVYSNEVFLVCRGYEFIRDEICYNKLDVKLVGTGAADFLGFSHNFQKEENSYDLLKNLPNLEIGSPKSKQQLRNILKRKGATFIKI